MENKLAELEQNMGTLVTQGFLPMQEEVQALRQELEAMRDAIELMKADWLTAAKPARSSGKRHVLNKETYVCILTYEGSKPSIIAKALGIADSTVRKYLKLSDVEAADLPETDPNWVNPMAGNQEE